MTAEIADGDVFDCFAKEWIDKDNIAFLRGVLAEQLLVNRCGDCGNWYQPPWPTCPECWSFNVVPTEVSGVGAVHTFTVAPRSEHALAVIDLAEQDDLRASGLIIGCEPDDVSIGMLVELVWITRDGHPVPAFRPVPRSQAAVG